MVYNFFDWDDTIVFTRRAQYLSYKESLLTILNYDLDWHTYNSKFYGNSGIFLASLGLDTITINNIKNLKNNLLKNKFSSKIELIYSNFKSNEVNLIVSNSTLSTIEVLLDKFQLKHYFAHVIASDSYPGANKKPSSDLYHFAFSKIDSFNLKNDSINIFEDSHSGAIGAINFISESLIPNIKLIFKPCNKIYLNEDFYPKYTNLNKVIL